MTQTQLTDGHVTRVPAKAPAKYRKLNVDPATAERVSATFGSPTNLEGFAHPIGSSVRIGSGKANWLVLAHAETPSGTEPRSYKVVALKANGIDTHGPTRVVGESSLVGEAPATATEPRLTFVDVGLNAATGEIEPMKEPEVAPATASARGELGRMLEASVLGDAPPTATRVVDEPCLHAVEPIPSRFEPVTTWREIGKPAHAPVARAPSAAQRLNAPFADDSVITVLVASNPKKVGSKARDRFDLYRSGSTVAEAIRAGVTMADVKYDAAHRFVRVIRATQAA